MTLHSLAHHLSQKVRPLALAGTGAAVLICGYAIDHHLQTKTVIPAFELRQLQSAEDQSLYAANHFQAMADLKASDVEQFKSGMAMTAQSNKTLFETGLSLHEEKRLLEKQWDILTHYLTLDLGIQRILLMRGDQALESYFINYVPLKAFGAVPPSLPRVVRITSKERYAHPERGNAEVIDGKLQWEPPQVGTSVRSNALGEFVLFTNSRLIMHGPPNNPVDHEAFPHICMGLSLKAAQNLYRHSFIGTKVIMPASKETVIPVVAPVDAGSEASTDSPNGF
jgi:hypothetical protein